MTNEEYDLIVNKVIEKVLLRIPDVLGNLMSTHAIKAKLNSDFYSKYPEFKNHKSVVAAVVESVEGSNSFTSYEDILKAAIPEIRKQIKLKDSLDINDISYPNLNFKNSQGSNNGEL